MKIAVIDIGTNSTRILIADYRQGNIYHLYNDLQTTRIGEGIGNSCIIKPRALERTIDCLKKYIDKCNEFNVNRIRIVATSAVRDAENKDLVKKEVFLNTGVNLEILTGEKEAKLSYLGAISDFFGDKKKYVVLDIGGGSTELIYYSSQGIQYKSVNLGAVRLSENILLKQEVSNILMGLVEGLLPNDFILVGVGGTVTTLAAIKLELDEYDPDLVHGQELDIKEINEINNWLQSLSLNERKKVKGLQPERADIILFGIFILQKVMEKLGVTKIKVSEKDILYGMIITTEDGDANFNKY
ncbi:MAG: exopolyphosphatase / guanosine-5-triphosphate,3-diphosphate pyrophosphatase [Clostridia bacterium]|jgi:exopolyphosphatase/guanosine-5'-triphosphate,3'-diphosphate pyrophosphatase|nr:exopolyphosphatase / guanosine-5-triphosphate,3-diphosphate pyrophosphatase [Clostridia bacterium]MDN5321661.1 exopolyphosphatase / guanosine-5-triphosphate,3-diphosphate pyrophosphatase [Clostridia bacterium]